MAGNSCSHPDVRKFDGIRCCLACGEAVFEATKPETTAVTVTANKYTEYEYIDLKYQLGQEIRLAVLLPGAREDPLRAEIIHVNLEDRPEYDAISYTWATEDEDTSLSGVVECLQGGSIKITRNCDAVLRQLRQRGLRRNIWIDAICINQANIRERNHQVGLMDKIYQHARSVRMCIQDQSGQTDFSEYGQLFRALQSDKVEDITNAESPLFLIFVYLVNLRYFQRAWVIQEAALARTAYLLVNSNELLLTPTVMDCLRLASKRHKFDVPGVLRWNPGHKVEADIVTCLRIGIECKSSDARDKVYALLGLMEPYARSLIPVDYSLTVESVYSNAVIAVVAVQQTLDVLLYATILWDFAYFDDWTGAVNMDIEKFRQFLFHTSIKGQCEPDPKPGMHTTKFRDPQFERRHSIGPWKSTVKVDIVTTLSNSDNYDGDGGDDSQQQNATCILQRPRPGRLDILPRMHVRAHYIDSVEKTFLDARKFTKAVLKDARLLTAQEFNYSAILPFFKSELDLSPVEVDPEIPPNLPLEHAQSYLPHVNVAELLAFIEDAATRENSGIFLGTYCVGLANHETFEQGNAIFAVDGVSTPLLLRETSDHHFRVLGPCHVHAVLELDYWNPGTRKGRWGTNFYGPRNRQTRMIQIE